MPKTETESSDYDSSEESSPESSSDSSSRVPSSRRNSRKSSDEEEPDPREQYILPTFKPTPVKSEVSDFAKKALRNQFLGLHMGQQEHKQLQEDYFCSPKDYRLFSAPTINNSPLALLKFSDSTALEDLTSVHNRLLFAMRVGLLSYERTLTLFAKWAPASTHPLSNKSIPAGPWATFDYKFRSGNVPYPVPHELRSGISQTSIDELLARDFVTNANTDEDKLLAMARWALSYKEAFMRQQGIMDEIHIEALKYSEALKQVHESVDILRKDTGSSMRLTGAACQQIKKIREQKYTDKLDPEFKKYLDSKKRSYSPETNRENRAGPLVASDLASEAKKFGKLKHAMESVSKKKKRKDFVKSAVADKRSAAAKPFRKDKKEKGKGGGKDKGKGRGKTSEKAAANKAAKKRVKAKKDKAKKDKDDSE